MKRLGWLLSVLAGLLVVSAAVAEEDMPAGAEEPKPAKKRPAKAGKKHRKERSMLRGHYGMMAKVLEMTDEQKKNLEAQVVANHKAEKEWTEASAARKKDLHEKLAAAKKAKNAEEIKKLSQEQKALRDERNALREANEAKIMALLTDAQKVKWQGWLLWRGVQRRYRKLKLDEKQTEQMKQICEAEARTMPSADVKTREGRKARAEAVKKLQDKLDKVLTAEQLEEMKKKPEPKPKPAKEGKGERRGKPKGEKKAEPEAEEKADEAVESVEGDNVMESGAPTIAD
jgi:hypothetical protein